MVEAWRIVPERWSENAFDGEGARLYGGRWNSPGVAAVYLADTRALAALETLVHHRAVPKTKYLRFPVRFKKELLEKLEFKDTQGLLQSLTVAPETQAIGNKWLAESRKPILEVPSAIIPEEKNYLLNPQSARIDAVEIGEAEPFALDPRLLNV